MDKFDETARRIVEAYTFADEVQPITKTSLIDDIAKSLRAAATVPPGHVRVGTEDMRLLGTLPVTKDRVVVMPGHEVFHPDADPAFHLRLMESHEDTEPDPDFPLPDDCEYVGHYSYYERDTGYWQYESYDVRSCYSTQAAALASKGARDAK